MVEAGWSAPHHPGMDAMGNGRCAGDNMVETHGRFVVRLRHLLVCWMLGPPHVHKLVVGAKLVVAFPLLRRRPSLASHIVSRARDVEVRRGDVEISDPQRWVC